MKKKLITFIVNKRVTAFALLFVALCGMCFAAGKTGAYAVYYNAAPRKLPIYSVERNDKKIAISFDCAWGAEKTQGLIDCMAEYNVKCTFFMTEFWAEKYPDFVLKIHEAGHEIGTHSATHSYMSKLSEEKITEELKTSSAAIERVTGEKVTLFRPPYGDYNDRLISTCEKLGYFSVQWSVDSLDWKEISASDISARIISKVSAGAIILCHNNAKNTLDALPHIFADLQGRGYEFVPVGELIYKQDFKIDAAGRQRPSNN